MIKVELIDNMGSDLTVVNSARVSFNKQSTLDSAGELPQGDARLIQYLAKHKHFTPFTHPQITLCETVPIFVARQRFKHVVGFTYNEVSRRYVDDVPEFYIPDAWRSRPEGSVKQGSAGVHHDSTNWMLCYKDNCEEMVKIYVAMLEDGVAPEQARMILPQSMMTSYYVTGSLAAYARMCVQRSDSHAQKEIQELASQVNAIIAPLYPVAWSALTAGAY